MENPLYFLKAGEHTHTHSHSLTLRHIKNRANETMSRFKDRSQPLLSSPSRKCLAQHHAHWHRISSIVISVIIINRSRGIIIAIISIVVIFCAMDKSIHSWKSLAATHYRPTIALLCHINNLDNTLFVVAFVGMMESFFKKPKTLNLTK